MAAFAADPAFLRAAEGSARVGHEPAIQADHADLQGLGRAQAERDVLGIDVRDQAVLGRVRRGDRLVDVVESHDRRHRPEDLLAEDRRLRIDLVQDSRREVEARDGRCPPAGEDRCAAVHRIVDERADLAASICVHERAEIGAVRVAGSHRNAGHRPSERAREVIRERLVHVEAIRCGTCLAAITHLRRQGTGHGGLDVCPGQYEERGVAAKFHRGAEHSFGGRAEQADSHLSGSRE